MRISARRWWRGALVAALLLIFWCSMTTSVRRMSQTFDEGFHLFAGWRYIQCRDFGINTEHPPLMKLVAASALRLEGVPPPAGVCGAEPTTKDYGYGSGERYLFKQGLDADAVLYRARRGVTVFALALAVLTFFFARRLFGYWAGVVALTLVTFDPTVLAHGALLTTDTALCACLLGTVFAVYLYIERPSLLRLLLCGVALGLTLAAKHSGILVLPITLLLFLFAGLRRRGDGWRLARLAGAWAIAVLVGVGVLWAVYGFHFSGRPGNAAMTLPLNDFLAQVRSQGTRGFLPDFAIPLAARWHLVPLPYLYGLTDVLSIMLPGQPPFLLGKLYPHGQWFYFPVVFLLKNTLEFLALLLLGLVGGGWLRRDAANPDRRWKLVVLLTPVVVIWAAAMQSGLNIGYRHVLTTFAFLAIVAAGGCVAFVARRPIWTVPVAIVLVLHAGASLRAWPNYLPYMNEALGGTMQSYRYMTDANVDWGQGVLSTRDWLAAHKTTNCWLAYDGAVALSYYHLPCQLLPGNQGDSAAGAAPPAEATGTFVISSLAMSGIEWEPGALNPYAKFLQGRPAANIGGAMLVYEGTFDLRAAQAAELIALSGASLEKNAALAAEQARRAIALTPTSVRAYMALARADKVLGDAAGERDNFAASLKQAEATGAEWYPWEMAEAKKALAALPANQ
jgi:4-amino-4-deoxy-L-arabinose transferase-like glycosyltransferase